MSAREPALIIPPGLDAYRRTPEFDEHSVPAKLLQEHCTKEGTWGLIRVTEGELIYRVTDERRVAREYRLTPDAPGIVEPTILHQVTPHGRVRFFVEFYR